MVCYQCGFPISNIKEVFDMMRQIKTIEADQARQVHVSNRIVDSNLNVILIDAFEALGVKKYCCRAHITSTINFHDLEIGN